MVTGRLFKFILLFFLGLAPPVQAETPGITPPATVAMVFHRLAGSAPDFAAWAKMMPEYQSALTFDRQNVLSAKVAELKNAYALLTLQEPIVAEMRVKLSPYSETNRGFFVEGLDDDAFFPVEHAGNFYAVIPRRIGDRQWVKVPNAAQAAALTAARDSAPDITMVFFLMPKYADRSAPADIGGKPHWLLSAEILKTALYAADSKAPLWQSEDAHVDGKKRQELLKLK